MKRFITVKIGAQIVLITEENRQLHPLYSQISDYVWQYLFEGKFDTDELKVDNK